MLSQVLATIKEIHEVVLIGVVTGVVISAVLRVVADEVREVLESIRAR